MDYMINGKVLLELAKKHKENSQKSLERVRTERDNATGSERVDLNRWCWHYSGECFACDNFIAVIQEMIARNS